MSHIDNQLNEDSRRFRAPRVSWQSGQFVLSYRYNTDQSMCEDCPKMTKTLSRSDLRRWIVRSVVGVLLLALALMIISSRSVAQQPVAVRVQGPTSPVVAGQSFVVTLLVENAQNLGAFEFEYNFTPAVASAMVDNIQLGPFLGSTGRTTGALRLASAPGRPGVPLFGAYSYGTANGPNGNGVLATVAMTAVAPGTSQLSLTQQKVTNITGDEVTSISMAGSVTVIGPRLIYMPLLRRNSGN